MLFLRLFLANFNNFPIFWALNAVKKNEIKKDMMKWTKENTRKIWKKSKNEKIELKKNKKINVGEALKVELWSGQKRALKNLKTGGTTEKCWAKKK